MTIGYNQRFLISDERRFPPICYQISKIEDTQPIGITKFKLTQETYNPSTDNYELMLANYYNSQIKPEVAYIDIKPTPTATITYNGTKPTVKVGGSFKIFTPVFDNDNVTVQSWLVSDENGDISSDTENYTIEYEGSKLKLKIAQNYNLINKKLVVLVNGSDGSSAELKVEVV